jgi:hypothetical protein
MIFTKIVLYRQLQRRSIRWTLWCLAWLIISCVPVAWAQLPTPEPPLPPLFGAQVEGVAATSDTGVDFTLESGSVLSGKIRDVNGAEVTFATVFAQSENGTFSGSLTAELNPNNPTPELKYRIVLPDGTYHMFVSMTAIDLSAPPSQPLLTITFDLQETVVVAGNTERDLMVPEPPPFSTLTGQVVSLGTLPSEGNLLFQSEDGQVLNIAPAEMAAGATQATYRVTLPTGTYHVSFIVTLPEFPTPDGDPAIPPPPPDPEVPLQSLLIPVGTVMVSADQVFDINVPATVTLSGKLQDNLGMALAGSTIFAVSELPLAPPPPPSPMSALCQAGSLTTIPIVANSSSSLLDGNTLGDYELQVVPGDYQVGVATVVDLISPATVPPGTLETQQGGLTFPFPPEMMTITEDQMRDFTLPPLPEVVLISGRVVDQQNQPVSGAHVRAVSSMLTATPNALFSNNVETNEMGDYQLLALNGTDYTVTVCPPEPSGLIAPSTP